MLSTRRFVLPALIVLFALPAMARSLDAPKAPPTEPVYEVDPGDRAGYTYVTGHWEWTGDKFMWSPGKWVAEREGYVWVNDSWAQRGKKWHLIPGHYDADGSASDAATGEAHSPHGAMENGEAAEKENGDEMDEVEKKVLAPGKKSASATDKKNDPHHKRTTVKKKVDYKDPKQFPFYHHH